jgi:transcriptional regulator with XRE-family HTH domain
VARTSVKTDNCGALIAIGKAIRATRKSQKLSQEALADAAKIERSHMGRIERGERNLTTLNLLRIASALNCKASALLAAADL